MNTIFSLDDSLFSSADAKKAIDEGYARLRAGTLNIPEPIFDIQLRMGAFGWVGDEVIDELFRQYPNTMAGVCTFTGITTLKGHPVPNVIVPGFDPAPVSVNEPMELFHNSVVSLTSLAAASSLVTKTVEVYPHGQRVVHLKVASPTQLFFSLSRVHFDRCPPGAHTWVKSDRPGFHKHCVVCEARVLPVDITCEAA